ncbi:MAG: phage tail tape measure C-terminal domain-containing protein [Propionivibrio sp.]
MANNLGRLTVDLLLQTAGFESGFNKAERIADAKTRQIERQARERAKAIEQAFGNISGAIAGVFAGLQIGQFAKSVVDMQGRLDDLAKSTGISATNLAGLDHAARQSGSNLDSVASAVNKLAVNMGNNAEKFAKLGVTAKDPVDALGQLADILNGIEDPQKRAAVAAEALGKGWQELAPLLSEGSAGIRALVDEGQKLSGVTEENNKQAAAFGDNLEKLHTASIGLANTITSPLIPALNDLITGFTEAAKAKNIFGWAITSGDDEDNAVSKYTEITLTLRKLREDREALAKPTFTNKVNDFIFGDVHDLDLQISALEKQQAYLKSIIDLRAKADGYRDRWIPNTPTTTTSDTAVNGFLGGNSTAKAISESQRLIEQLQQRLMTAQKLSEVEKLTLTLADTKYNKMTEGERTTALALAGQIDQRSEIARQLDDEISSARELSRVYEQQESRLKQLIGNTDAGKNVQNMMDEALAESALLSGKIDTSTYDQIIAKLHEVKDEGKDSFKELQDAIEGWGRQATDVFVNFAFTGKTSFADMTTSILKDMSRMIIQQNVMKPLMSGIGDFFSGLFGGSGGAAQMAGVFVGSANGNVFSGSPSLHQYANTIQTSPKLFGFDTLHGFAKGGIFAEAGPEAVMPLARDSAGRLGVRSQGDVSGVSIAITINAETGAQQTNGDTKGAWTEFANRIKGMILDELTTQKRPGGLLYS